MQENLHAEENFVKHSTINIDSLGVDLLKLNKVPKSELMNLKYITTMIVNLWVEQETVLPPILGKDLDINHINDLAINYKFIAPNLKGGN